MPGVYRVSLGPSTVLSTTANTLTINASSTKPLRLLYADVKGHGNVPAQNSVVLYRSSGGTASTAVTPSKAAADMSAPSFTAYSAYSSQPTLGEVLHRFEVNANGGIDRYQAFPGCEIYLAAGEQISLRSESGTSNVLVNFEIQEG